VQDNIRTLGVEDRATLLVTSAFLWAKRDLADMGRTITSVASDARADTIVRSRAARPWLVFCSPPYAFFHERQADMIDLVGRVKAHAPKGSILVVEADEAFDFALLRQIDATDDTAEWQLRTYPPAVVGLWRN
jgi:16S rRNA (guanine966-N2)-methyltransferase